MKKTNYFLSVVLIGALAACNGGSKELACPDESVPYVVTTIENVIPADSVNGFPEYVSLEKTQVDMNAFPKDADGAYILFCGKSMYGWRGYNKDTIPARWSIDSCTIKFKGRGEGEAQDDLGGDLIFAHKFKNFELTFEWKVAKGSNSGVFVLAQEIKDQPIYISAPEYQLLDNENHPDAKQGVNGDRQSASLYDMIPAVPQNAKPFGEWNTGSIIVYKGSVFYAQNGKTVVEYHLWTPQWTDLLQNGKFKPDKNGPFGTLAFKLLNNCGGDNHEGYIGLQDHSDDIWFRNIKIKITD